MREPVKPDEKVCGWKRQHRHLEEKKKEQRKRARIAASWREKAGRDRIKVSFMSAQLDLHELSEFPIF